MCLQMNKYLDATGDCKICPNSVGPCANGCGIAPNNAWRCVDKAPNPRIINAAPGGISSETYLVYPIW